MGGGVFRKRGGGVRVLTPKEGQKTGKPWKRNRHFSAKPEKSREIPEKFPKKDLPTGVACAMVYSSCFPKGKATSLESLRVSAEGVRQEGKRTCCISQAKGQGVKNFLRELIYLYQLFLFA